MNILQKVLIGVFILLALGSCKNTGKDKEYKAIVINYKVKYLDKTAGSIRTNLLPKKMKLILADKYAKNSIEGFFGQFSLSYIANIRKNRVITLLKIFDKKYYYIGEKNELPCGIDHMSGISITQTGKTKSVLGFNCNEYLCKVPGEEDIQMYGSDEIKFRSPNSTTPYKNIDDVLLQFYTKLSVLEMVLVADDYNEELVSESSFKIPEGYKEVSLNKMENTLSSLFN